MTNTPRTITPGRYRVFLAPTAVAELMLMLAWGGFSLKSHRTAQSPLHKMVREGKTLHPSVSIQEDNSRGLEPRFSESGFIKPPRVALIERLQGDTGDPTGYLFPLHPALDVDPSSLRWGTTTWHLRRGRLSLARPRATELR